MGSPILKDVQTELKKVDSREGPGERGLNKVIK